MSATAHAISDPTLFGALSDYARTDSEFWDAHLRKIFRLEFVSWTNDRNTKHLEASQREMAEGLTATEAPSQEIYERIESLLAIAREASVRDEMEEQFANEMNFVLNEYGNETITAIADLILAETVRPVVASEILDLLGRINHPATYRHRLWLLERALMSPSTKVRHAASLGLAYLRDPHALRYLKSAIESEQVRELKNNLKQVFAYVERGR